MNTTVSFEIAKLLKEKGFDKPTIAYRQKSAVIGDEKILPLSVPNHEFYWGPVDWNNYSEQVPYYSMPTIAEVVMWLYEKHGVWIVSKKVNGLNKWFAQIYKNNSNDLCDTDIATISPAEAYTAAIGYVLTKLIK